MFNGKQLIANIGGACIMLASMWSYAQEPVDINTASAEVIAENLTGVGLSRAQAIIEYRETHGAFRTLSDVESVKGIGAATIEKNKERILFE